MWDQQGPALDDCYTRLQSYGYRVEKVDAKRFAALEPQVRGVPQQSLLFPSEAVADPTGLRVALLGAAQILGAIQTVNPMNEEPGGEIVEVDFIQDVPVQDLARVSGTDGLDVRTAPQNRVIFFGMNQGDADLKNDNVEGKNPFADVRVRQAVAHAIDRQAIIDGAMFGLGTPIGTHFAPHNPAYVDLVQGHDIDIAISAHF